MKPPLKITGNSGTTRHAVTNPAVDDAMTACFPIRDEFKHGGYGAPSINTNTVISPAYCQRVSPPPAPMAPLRPGTHRYRAANVTPQGIVALVDDEDDEDWEGFRFGVYRPQ